MKSNCLGISTVFAALALPYFAAGFQNPSCQTVSFRGVQHVPFSVATTLLRAVTNDDDKSGDEVSSSSNTAAEKVKPSSLTVERILKDNYPEFHKLLSQNERIFQQLEEDFSENGYTIFAPNSQAFAELTEKQRLQLEDPRNLETIQKMGLYHIVKDEAISYTQLNREDWTVPKTPEGLPALKFGALMTMGGEVPIERFKKKREGSFFRSLLDKKKTVRDKEGKPVTEIVVGPAGTILRSVKVGNAIIHEIDGFTSPMLLWRYFDQLRLPGL
mmetsp:Transcript_12339/g.23594  ORF Transcript_12339/g.23594 Transcript_12339/m.23594 type:complete len:272 (-) Transcript_12339:105-920(-)|eukprot:scaffold4534_cov85-Amphora_coffeaeformis.AAC.3